MPSQPHAPPALRNLKVLLTAHEAYPEMERLFLEARHEIRACFRIFDPFAKLRSDAALAVGETWFDLITHTLERGVSLRMVISDFDPVGRVNLHRQTWDSLRALYAAAEASGASQNLTVTAALHPAEVGVLPRIILWPKIRSSLKPILEDVNALPAEERDEAMRRIPLVARFAEKAGESWRLKRWQLPVLHPATHHQKLAVFDRKSLYIGGLDLDDRRFDTPEHDQLAQQTWHDVQLSMEGDLAVAAHDHLGSFLNVVEGKDPPAMPRGLLRTLSSKRKRPWLAMGPRPVLSEVAQAHSRHVREAQDLIYLETQFFRDRRLAHQLAEAALANPDLKLLMIVPAVPEEIAFDGRRSSDQRLGEHLQARCLEMVRDAFKDRFFIGSPVQPRLRDEMDEGPKRLGEAPMVYVHAKVSIFDDRAAIVSSANLNGRSLYWDTEAGVEVSDAEQVKIIREKCFRHWLPADAPRRFFDGDDVIKAWRELAEDNQGQHPEKRDGFILPYSIGAARRFGRAIPIVPEEMV
ncbi:phospholipase D-like domain-containing protein [Aestuariibius insulae]|uniref:phospholipase D-like domain-containing protein n=1 Tax=Aestuariibius insulae TaxID=2058287 RepID=UPI00345E71FB